MPNRVQLPFKPGSGPRSETEMEPVAWLAKVLTWGVIIVAAAYFAYLYLLAGR